MLTIPKLTDTQVALGIEIGHLPKYADIPEEYKDRSNEYAEAVSYWFFKGARRSPKGEIIVNGKVFAPRPELSPEQAGKALRAIAAALGSFEPPHERKIAGCAYLLHEWFELQGGGK